MVYVCCIHVLIVSSRAHYCTTIPEILGRASLLMLLICTINTGRAKSVSQLLTNHMIAIYYTRYKVYRQDNKQTNTILNKQKQNKEQGPLNLDCSILHYKSWFNFISSIMCMIWWSAFGTYPVDTAGYISKWCWCFIAELRKFWDGGYEMFLTN